MADRAAAVELRRLVEDDFPSYLRLRDASFGYPATDEVRATLLARLPSTMGAFVSGRLAASLADPTFEVFVAGAQVPLVGVAAVQTAPEQRRRGLAARLMLEALERARDAGIGWSALYPFDPGFYARYGWQGLPTGVRLELPLDCLPRAGAGFGAVAGPVTAERIDGDLRAALQELRLRCVRPWTFSNTRTRGPWDVWEGLLPGPGERGLAYRCVDGYVVLKQAWDDARPGSVLTVLDMAYATAHGRDEVLGLLAAFHGQANRAVIDLPSDDALVWDWSGWYSMRKRPTFMARVVDVPAALTRLRAVRVSDDGDVEIAVPPFEIRVRDAFASWNEGSYRVTPGRDSCAGERASGAGCSVDVRGLALLISGAAGAQAVLRAGLAEGEGDALAALSSLAALSGGVTPYQAREDAF